MVLIPMILSLTVHECAHAFTAKRLGDDTAERMGRMTLNPIPHIDPMGTIMLPLLILMARGASGAAFVPFFGWAKPTPVNESRFRRSVSVRAGSMAVAAAGPVSNLLMAWICAAALSVMFHAGQTQGAMAALVQFMNHMIFINLGLCVFNLIPVGAARWAKSRFWPAARSHRHAIREFQRALRHVDSAGHRLFCTGLHHHPCATAVGRRDAHRGAWVTPHER